MRLQPVRPPLADSFTGSQESAAGAALADRRCAYLGRSLRADAIDARLILAGARFNSWARAQAALVSGA